MGSHDTIKDAGYIECHPPSTYAHISTEDTQPNREGHIRQRIQALDCGVDGGE